MGLSNTELNSSCGIFNEIYGLPIYKAKNIENDFRNCRGQLVSREKKRESAMHHFRQLGHFPFSWMNNLITK